MRAFQHRLYFITRFKVPTVQMIKVHAFWLVNRYKPFKGVQCLYPHRLLYLKMEALHSFKMSVTVHQSKTLTSSTICHWTLIQPDSCTSTQIIYTCGCTYFHRSYKLFHCFTVHFNPLNLLHQLMHFYIQ